MSAILDKMVRITLILLIISVCSVFCFPANKPLNERSTELAWQAWLLVDDQNQSKQSDSQGPRRRITPKSVFIAPTFSPDNFPDCAEGYRSDPMGRCIKIIKLDEDAHLDFLLQKLNDKFGDDDYEDEVQEESPTAGPFQFNIPLQGGGGDYKSEEEEEEDSGMAIVLAPSSSGFDGNDSLKIDITRNNRTEPMSGNTVNVKTIAHILGVRQEDVETTTIFETTTPTDSTSTLRSNEDSTNTASTQLSTDTTMTFTETTVLDGDALFYLNPTEKSAQISFTGTQDMMMGDEAATTAGTSTTEDVQSTTTLEQSTLPTTTEETKSKTKDAVEFPEDVEPEGSSSDLIKFPDGPSVQHEESSYPEQYHNTRDTANKQHGIVYDDYAQEQVEHGHPNDRDSSQHRPFVDEDPYPPKVGAHPEKLDSYPHRIDIQSHSVSSPPHRVASQPHRVEYHPQRVELQPHTIESEPHRIESQPHRIDTYPHRVDSEPHRLESQPHRVESHPHRIDTYPHRVDSQPHELDSHPLRTEPHFYGVDSYPHRVESHNPSHPARHAYNHRSREKHNDLFILPPSIRDGSYSSQQKPLVLRFSRKHGYIDMSSLKSPEFYRQVASDDLSHLFGFRSRDSGHR